jgi:hypothetical protein
MLEKFADTTKFKTLGRFIGQIKKGYDKIGLRSISFTYSADLNLRNDYLSHDYLASNGGGFWDFFKYQAGFSGRNFSDIIAGTMDDDSSFGGMKHRYGIDDEELYRNDTRTTDRKYSISTGLDFKVPFELTLSPITLEWNDHIGKQAKDSVYYDKSKTFPRLQIGANTPALMKITLIKQNFRSMRCNSSYNYEKSAAWTSLQKYSEAIRHTLRPLISLSGDFAKAPVTITYSCETSNEQEKIGINKDTITSQTKEDKQDHSFSINYEIQKNSRLSEIKLFSWTIPVSGKTTVGLKVNGSRHVAKKAQSNDTAIVWEPTENLRSFSLSPKITYIFTDNINGEAFYERGQEKRLNSETKKTNKFAIILNVRL